MIQTKNGIINSFSIAKCRNTKQLQLLIYIDYSLCTQVITIPWKDSGFVINWIINVIYPKINSLNEVKNKPVVVLLKNGIPFEIADIFEKHKLVLTDISIVNT